MTPADRRALLAAHAAATPGPWAPQMETYPGYVALWHSLEAPVSRGSLDWHWIESAPAEMKLFPVVTGDGPTSKANAAFIAMAHAQVPKLCRALDEAEAEVERYREALLSEAEHADRLRARVRDLEQECDDIRKANGLT